MTKKDYLTPIISVNLIDECNMLAASEQEDERSWDGDKWGGSLQ